MPEDTSQAKVMLNSEKIKCIALAIVDLLWIEGIRQVGRLLANQSVGISIK